MKKIIWKETYKRERETDEGFFKCSKLLVLIYFCYGIQHGSIQWCVETLWNLINTIYRQINKKYDKYWIE